MKLPESVSLPAASLRVRRRIGPVLNNSIVSLYQNKDFATAQWRLAVLNTKTG